MTWVYRSCPSARRFKRCPAGAVGLEHGDRGRIDGSSACVLCLRRFANRRKHRTQALLPSIRPRSPCSRPTAPAGHRLNRRAEGHDRYTQVMALRAQGFGNAEIARRVGLTARTLQNWQKKGSFPEAGRRRKRPSCFDPYASYVLSRWEQGCQNGSQLYREIKEQGYGGRNDKFIASCFLYARTCVSFKKRRVPTCLCKIFQRMTQSGCSLVILRFSM